MQQRNEIYPPKIKKNKPLETKMTTINSKLKLTDFYVRTFYARL